MENNNSSSIGGSTGRQNSNFGRNWYAVHVYSGHEEAVKNALLQRIENLGMKDKIFDVVVPKEIEIVLKKGKPFKRRKCIFMGYVFVDMVVTDDSWYVVRNTPDVTGFVGSGTTPVPVTKEEFEIIRNQMDGGQPKYKTDFKKGDVVKIVDGPFATHEGIIDEVYTDKGKVRVLITLFERETPMELTFNQVQKK